MAELTFNPVERRNCVVSRSFAVFCKLNKSLRMEAFNEILDIIPFPIFNRIIINTLLKLNMGTLFSTNFMNGKICYKFTSKIFINSFFLTDFGEFIDRCNLMIFAQLNILNLLDSFGNFSG